MADQQQQTKGIVDIVFLIDATGSMEPCIGALKENIHTFVSSLTTADPNNASPVKDWRAKVVGYRDFEVDSVPIADNPFVQTVDELRTQLAALKAEGGGDEPESLLEALYHLATTPASGKGAQTDPGKWRHKTSAARVVVVFTDASFKEPLAKPKGATFDDVKNQLYSNRIILSIFAPEMPCYERLAELDKSEWIPVGDAATPQQSLANFTSDRKNFSRTLQQLARTISKSAEVLSVD